MENEFNETAETKGIDSSSGSRQERLVSNEKVQGKAVKFINNSGQNCTVGIYPYDAHGYTVVFDNGEKETRIGISREAASALLLLLMAEDLDLVLAC